MTTVLVEAAPGQLSTSLHVLPTGDSLIAGTIFASTKVPLRTWFRAMYHLTQSKGGISSLELGRRLGVTPNTAWKLKQAHAGDDGAGCEQTPDRPAPVVFLDVAAAATSRSAPDPAARRC